MPETSVLGFKEPVQEGQLHTVADLFGAKEWLEEPQSHDIELI